MTSNNTGYSSQTTGYTNSSGSYGSSNSVSQSTPSVNSYPSNSYSNNQTSYAYQTYPANNYHSSGQTYPPQSYQSAGATYPYQSAAAQQNHKMNASLGSSQGKDSQVCLADVIKPTNLWCSPNFEKGVKGNFICLIATLICDIPENNDAWIRFLRHPWPKLRHVEVHQFSLFDWLPFLTGLKYLPLN